MRNGTGKLVAFIYCRYWKTKNKGREQLLQFSSTNKLSHCHIELLSGNTRSIKQANGALKRNMVPAKFQYDLYTHQQLCWNCIKRLICLTREDCLLEKYQVNSSVYRENKQPLDDWWLKNHSNQFHHTHWYKTCDGPFKVKITRSTSNRAHREESIWGEITKPQRPHLATCNLTCVVQRNQ